MAIIRSRNGVPLRLTKERWGHIALRHPEMRTQKVRVIETVTEPDRVLEGDEGCLMATRLYSRTPLTRKYLVVVYREVQEGDGFIVTAYLARRLSQTRRTLWKRSGF